ncbi:M42 family metallopeptidase [Sedimentibacter sp. MB31-C6]|uniref:M42 family metallopeptidase n=1 Tax=Sedimentibacter sp. MB31-C6 TaxID=3109366 RepID=UPI002DDCEB71|nr:M20/M25/M40 family metallo-hydrolase [Sedimentibacter sp. MB36-C1]WSI04214.1 M20/M25/M40 family metallo-hydrolase [Sedimentibacter sp. MB36-C1]
MIKEFLLDLCSNQFVSGNEYINGNILIDNFQPYTDSYEKDKIGSYIFKSNGTNNKKIMLSAHIDEIGLMVTGILDDGFLRFTSVGGINPASLVSQEVIVYGNSEVYGVIGIKPPHITSDEERKKPLQIKDLFIDTGYSKEKLQELVSVGDFAVIKRDPIALQGSRISAKAFDDRACVAVMLEVAKELKKISHKSNIYYTASAQEETGCRGATTASYKINPDIGIVLDVGFGSTPDLPPETADLGKGPVVAYGGRLNSKLTKKFIEVCKKYNYKIQYEVAPAATGTDTESLQINREGIPCILLSIPLRYMHTSVETIDFKDVENTGKAIARFINEIDNSDLEEILCF